MRSRTIIGLGALCSVFAMGVTAAFTAPNWPTFPLGPRDSLDQSSGHAVLVADLMQENGFLKLGDIKGKATTDKYKDQVVFNTMHYSVHQGGEWEEGDRLSGRITTFGEMVLTKDMDISSPPLAVACATKQQFDKGEIALVAGGKDAYLKVVMENIIVTNVMASFSADSPRPSETITLSYRKATWEWGTAKGGYDLAKNTKV